MQFGQAFKQNLLWHIISHLFSNGCLQSTSAIVATLNSDFWMSYILISLYGKFQFLNFWALNSTWVLNVSKKNSSP